MSITVIENARLLVGGYDLSGAMNAATLTERGEALEATTFADSAVARKPGLEGVALAAAGFCDPAVEDGMADGLALTDVPISVVPDDTEGAPAYLFRALLARLDPLAGHDGDMAEMSLEAESSQAALSRGLLGAHRTVTATGTGTAFQVGPEGAGRLLTAALHVTAASASDTLDVVIQSASDEAFTAPTTRLTFAQVAAAGSEWASATFLSWDTWWRVAWTVGGASPSFTLAVTMEALAAETASASDLFAGVDATAISNHTPTSGWTSWQDRNGTSGQPALSSNRLLLKFGSYGTQEHILAAPTLTSDHFEYSASIVPVGTGSRAGLRFRCNSTLGDGSEFIKVWAQPVSETSLTLFIARMTSGWVAAETTTLASGLNLGSVFTAGYDLGVSVDGDTVTVWTAAYGHTDPALRTTRGTKTLTTDWNDASHQQFGLSRAGGGDLNTIFDNLTLTYLA